MTPLCLCAECLRGSSDPVDNRTGIKGQVGSAELVSEEVCVSSHQPERANRRAYARTGVRQCWVVLGPLKQIEVHRQPAAEQFAGRPRLRQIIQQRLTLAEQFGPALQSGHVGGLSGTQLC